MRDRLLRAGAGEGAHLELDVTLSGLRLLRRHRAQPAQEEPERDGDDAGVLQGEPGEVDVGREQREAVSGDRVDLAGDDR